MGVELLIVDRDSTGPKWRIEGMNITPVFHCCRSSTTCFAATTITASEVKTGYHTYRKCNTTEGAGIMFAAQQSCPPKQALPNCGTPNSVDFTQLENAPTTFEWTCHSSQYEQ
jgi:hypothetical protein